jgi:hypothetical protein
MLWQYCLAPRGFALIASRRGTAPLLFRKSRLSHPQGRLYRALPPGPRRLADDHLDCGRAGYLCCIS